jgi:hypothetical protein
MITRNTVLTAAAAVAMMAQVGLHAAMANEAPAAIPTQLLAVENEPAPKLMVDARVAAALARGVALIPYRVENLRILPVLGDAAAGVSPRVGHLHVTVDDLPWHWAEFSNDGTIVVAGLPAGAHKVTIELAGPKHHVYTGKTVAFAIPAEAAHAH